MNTGAQIIVKALEDLGVDTVFGYPGAANAPIYSELSKSSINHILPRGEQAAAHEAAGYARVSGKTGVCMATSGPGATNLITGIANAYIDSVPIVAITGQVDSDKIGLDVFQEADITSATAPFCKHNYLVKDITSLSRIIREAFYIASTGRPGPVLIDIPMDIQLGRCEYTAPDVDIKGYKPTYKGNGFQVKKAVNAVSHSKRPLIVAGGGIIISDAKGELADFAEKSHIPVVTTLMGLCALPTNHPLNFGMIGSHGFAHSNFALQNADLIIMLGSRAADRAINPKVISGNAKVVHVDIDPAEIGKVLPAAVPLVGDLKTVLPVLTAKVSEQNTDEWINEIKIHTVKRKYTDKDLVNPKYALKLLSETVKNDTIVTTEVGQNQLWTARNWVIKDKSIFLTSGGIGTMGYGLPAAIGAKAAAQKRTVIAVAGDGSFQMSLPELATIAGCGFDIKIVLLRNNRLGMVNELQKLKKYNRCAVKLCGSPDFCALAKAYGISCGRASTDGELESAFDAMLKSESAYLLELEIDPEESTMD